MISLRTFFLIVVFCTVWELTCADVVSEVTCTVGGHECDNKGNSVCDATALKCKCPDDSAENPTDGSTCVKVVSATPCTEADPCQGIDHSECSHDKCKCADGFTEKVNTCVKVVSATTCSVNGDCNAITNSECSNGKCKCVNGFKEKLDKCVKVVSATTCSGSGPCDKIANSVCSSDRCKCKDGYKETLDTCVKDAESSAQSVGLSTGIITSTLFVIVLQKCF